MCITHCHVNSNSDISIETAMGVSVNAQLNADSDYVKYVREMSKIPLGRSISLFKKNDLLYKFSRDHYKEKKAVKGLHDVTYSVIDARRSELKENKSHDERADDSAIDGVLLSRDEIREEVDTFMFGGHDTTSSGISFTLLLLAHHPDIQSGNVLHSSLIFILSSSERPGKLHFNKLLTEFIVTQLQLKLQLPN
ncbi:hypothetical protein NQ317_003794 [Molorchus minor]|uniref:Cytochrome P450 n=1 Tax=Molorchus minor TaxID=1323400 RepID=A0ABQ9JVW9_9CUCU|nr:hypothetical protein NQ317_003794 [Molorchus minor]